MSTVDMIINVVFGVIVVGIFYVYWNQFISRSIKVRNDIEACMEF